MSRVLGPPVNSCRPPSASQSPENVCNTGASPQDSRAKLLISIRPQQPGRAGPVLLGGAGFPALPGAQWPEGSEEEVGLRLTDANGGLAPQQQLQALGTVGQAAVVQGCAALPRLFVQVPTGKDGQRERQRPREREREISGQSAGLLCRGLGFGSRRGSRCQGSWPAGSLILFQGWGVTAPAQLVAGGGLGLRPSGNKRQWQSWPKKGARYLCTQAGAGRGTGELGSLPLHC